MNIDKYLDIISACRFCFMCRHLSANGLATGRECDTPRSHALIADLVRMDKANLANPDYIRTIYESDLSGANRRHCRGYHADTNCYDEIGLQLALRRDIVEAGLAPAEINAIAEQLKDFLIRADTQSTDKYSNRHLSRSIYTNIENVIGICLILKPCTTIRNDCAREQSLTDLIVSNTIVDTR